jgi:hypothetical protein
MIKTFTKYMDSIHDRFFNWCYKLEPGFIGFWMYLMVFVSLAFLLAYITISLLIFTNGWAGVVVVPLFFVYVLCIAFFGQPKQ